MPLENPTVADLVDLLIDLPPEAPVKIHAFIYACKEDVLSIDLDALGCVWLSGTGLQ